MRKRRLLPPPPPTPQDMVWQTMLITVGDRKLRVTRLWPAKLLSAFCRQKMGDGNMTMIEKLWFQSEIAEAIAEYDDKLASSQA